MPLLPSVMMYRIPILFWRLPDTGPTAGAKEKLAKFSIRSGLSE